MNLRILDFWDMTPHEFLVFAHAHADDQKRDQENDIVNAYLTAYWQRVKKLEPLDKILKKMQPKKQTPEQMLTELKRLNAQLGGTTY